ncbi:MAG: ArnT family glycosyltransferase, partial [Vicinamibacterales bacterium]
ALYTYRLDAVPAYLTLDEAHFAVHAHSIARTGRNLDGQFLPLLISLEDPLGEPMQLPWGHTHYLPLGMYLIAGALEVLPFNESTVRLPAALLGGFINIVLIYALALALLQSRMVAASSAALLAVAPANLIISRPGIDSVCQLPFTLGGLCCVAWYLRTRDDRLALAAGVIFGLGIYAYVTSVVMMPCYLMLFWLVSWHAGLLTRRVVMLSLAGFVAALLPMAAWLVWHPDALRGILLQYNRADPGSTVVMAIAQQDGAIAAMREFVRVYWSYFDPSFMFVTGSNMRTLTTHQAGVFLLPVALLVPLGLWHLRTNRTAQLLLIVCVLVAPIPAVIKGAPYQIQRASGLLVFVSLLAGCGVAALWTSRLTTSRALALILVLASVWQFAVFYNDYHGGYRVRSAGAYDPTAFPEAAETIIAADRRSPTPAIYLPAGLYDISAKWRFHATKHDRIELLQRTRYVTGASSEVADAPIGAWAVLPIGNAGGPATAGWATIKIVRTLEGEATLVVLRRSG